MGKLEMVLPLGDPRLYEKSEPVEPSEIDSLQTVIHDLHDILFEFRAMYNAGRGIAAPQIGVMKRLIYINIDKPVIIINPQLTELSEEMFEMWDDCMCFPNLLVKLKRHSGLRLTFRDEHWIEHSWLLTGPLSELIQHEYDHLDGILATQRALDEKSFRWRPSPA